MFHYQDAAQLYDCLEALFTSIETENPRASDALLKARLRIDIVCTNPTAHLTIDGRQRPLRIQFGPMPGRADLQVALAAATLHAILLGRLTLTKALGSKQLRAKGPVWKAAVLGDIFSQAKHVYPAILQERGLTAD